MLAIVCRSLVNNNILNQIFESVITSFLKDRVGLSDKFLTDKLSLELRKNILKLVFDKKLKQAQIGNRNKRNQNNLIRSDSIYWLDRSHENIYENDFFDVIDAFVIYLNETCYLGITGYEFHYALYDKGSFYKRHLDQFRDNQQRAYSMIMYLNEDWELADGGQLCIYHKDYNQTISPTNGKCVFFKSSELEHEVLLNQKSRMSITGWLKTN